MSEDPRFEEDQTIDYESDEANEDTSCPICGVQDLEHREKNLAGGDTYYTWNCTNCGFETDD